MSDSLYRSDLSSSPNIRVYDDCSTNFDKNTLETLFPTAKTIKINNTNLNADKNMYQMYVDFLQTDDDYFFNADSDIIFNTQWLNNAITMIEKTDGILSLFNTAAHKPYTTIDDLFCLKYSIGAAGTFFKRDCVSYLLNYFDSLDKVRGFDWQWSEHLKNNGFKIYCVNKSLIQHIGYTGYHSGLYFDVGRGFKVESILDGQIINDILVNCIDNNLAKDKEYKLTIENMTERDNSFLYHLSRCFSLPIRKLLPKYIKNKLKLLLKKKENQ